ncbi:MAG: cytochrome c [Bradymonadaceae bacterium]
MALGAGLTLVVLALIGVGFVYSGIYNVAADKPDGEYKRWLLESTRRASIDARAQDLEVPDLSSSNMLQSGSMLFRAQCTQCHGTPDFEPPPLADKMKPSAPWLCDPSRKATESNLRRWFWVTKHGIEMTGMPAWGGKKSDRHIWALVAVLKKCVESGDNGKSGG